MASTGLYFADKADLGTGQRLAADLFGIGRKEMRAYYAMAYLKFARRVAFVLNARSRSDYRSQALSRCESVFEDAQQAYSPAA